MLEQAIIDAAALREAALKNAEQSLIEKYAPQIKEAVEAMLENETPSAKRMYQGRSVDVIHEADEDGNVTISATGGKPFIVNESELTEANEEDLLQEEEMATASEGSTEPPTNIEAPPAWDSRYGETQNVTLTAMLDSIDSDGNVEIDLDDIELSLAQQKQAKETKQETSSAETASDASGASDTSAESDVGGGEEEGLEGLFGDLEDNDLQLQELLSILSEYDEELLEEDIEVDMDEDKKGWIDSAKESRKYETDKAKAKEAHLNEDEEDGEEEEEEDSSEEERLQESKEFNQLQQVFLILKEQNERLESVVNQLNEKLEDTLLSNAKLLYQNRTLNDASLNERQKSKIVEAISNAESPKEAKSLHETLRATVGSDQKKSPQSLNETVNCRSNLSSMLNTRQNLNESQNSDPFFDKMKKLAGIKNNK
jgi:hypothetical protein